MSESVEIWKGNTAQEKIYEMFISVLIWIEENSSSLTGEQGYQMLLFAIVI